MLSIFCLAGVVPCEREHVAGSEHRITSAVIRVFFDFGVALAIPVYVGTAIGGITGPPVRCLGCVVVDRAVRGCLRFGGHSPRALAQPAISFSGEMTKSGCE